MKYAMSWIVTAAVALAIGSIASASSLVNGWM